MKMRGALLFLLIIGYQTAYALEPWPATAQWVKLYNANWQIMQDPSGDFSQGSIDFVNDAAGTAAYFYATSTSVFFRFSLRETPLKSGTNELVQFAWYVAFDVDDDFRPDWSIMVGGITETLRTFYNPGIDDDPEAMNTNINLPLTTGDVKLVAGGYAAFPNLTYLDVQVPFTALQKSGYNRNITRFTPLRMFYSTSTSEAVVIKDALGPSTTIQAAFADAIKLTFSGAGAFGYIYDSRDPTPYSNAGTWLRNETVTLSGQGWPPSTSPYYNGGSRNLRILDATQTIVWSGTVTTNANGNLTSAPSWPVSLTVAPGIYTIVVQDPKNSTAWLSYDTFTIAAPLTAISKSVTPGSTTSGSSVSYSIIIQNTGTVAGQISTVADVLPTGFTYLTGTTTGLTTTNPTINGQQLTWNGSWSVPAAGQVTLNFQSRVGLSRGTFNNIASTSGGNFATKTTGNTAPVTVQAPILTLVKTVDKTTGIPSEQITYTVTYTNAGDANAQNIFILENIPLRTTYLSNSAAGSNMTILYSHDNGVTYNSSQSAPVTNLSFQRSTALAPGAISSITFKVTIQ